MIKPENYFVVHGWMRERLKLKGNELMVYAIVYGFSQDGESTFCGSCSYIMDWLGISRTTAIAALHGLTERGLLIKEDRVERGMKFVDYRYNPDSELFKNCTPCTENEHPLYRNCTPPVQNFNTPLLKNCTPPVQNFNTINIEDNKGENKESHKERNNKGFDVVSLCEAEGIDSEVIPAIYDFIDMRKTIKKPMTEKAVQMLLKKLKSLSTVPAEQIAMLNESVINGWQSVYPEKKQAKRPDYIREDGTEDIMKKWGLK